MKQFLVGAAFIASVCFLLWVFIVTMPWSVYLLIAWVVVLLCMAIGEHVLEGI